MREVTYDKPRKASTIVIAIFMTLCLIATLIVLPISWKDVQEAVNNTAEEADSAAGAVAGGFVIALFGSLAVVLTMILEGLNIINCAILLPFSIKNRHSTLKGVRITSYVFDGLIALLLLTNIIKMVINIVQMSAID